MIDHPRTPASDGRGPRPGFTPRIIAGLLTMAVLSGVMAMAAFPAPSQATTQAQGLIVNGSFESGKSPWSFNGPNLYTGVASAGSHSAQICGYRGCNDVLAQTVTVPSTVTALSLGYSIFLQSGGTGIGSCTSSVTATLGTAAGAAITAMPSTCSSAPKNSWTRVVTDVSSSLLPYAGKKVRLSFLGRSTSTDRTSFFVDEVELMAATPSPTTATTSASPSSTTTTTTTSSPTTTSTTTPATTTTTSMPPATTRWIPPLGNVAWQWMIDHPLDLANPADMGTGVLTSTGAAAPDPTVYDIDGFDNPASTVAALHARGARVVCYIEVGAAEQYRPDYTEFPASTLGATMAGYASERYVDIRSPIVVDIIKRRIAMCAQKGFDAVETDIDESYTASTGFPLTKATQEQFMTTLADYMHSLGLSWFIKNPDSTDDSYAADMQPLADAVLTEQCNQYSSCGLLAPYKGRKAVFNAEYKLATSAFCPADIAAGFNGALFDVDLDAARRPC